MTKRKKRKHLYFPRTGHHTPAINVTLSVPDSGINTGQCLPSGPVVIEGHPDGTVKYLRIVRPESIHNKRSLTGWRNPSNWAFSRFSDNPYPGGTVEFITKDGCTPGHDYKQVLQFYSNLAGYVPIPSLGDNLRDSAVQKAYAGLKNQSVNLSVAFAEYKETADLFSSACTHIADGVRRFKRKASPQKWGRVKLEGRHGHGHVEGRLEKVPQDWLELQYGWKPLMADVLGACSAFDRRNKDLERFFAHVKGTSKDNIIDTFKGHDSNGIGWSFQRFIKYTCTVHMWYYMRNPLLVSLASLGITNPVELIWEKIPYSFVVDWFLPIGNWLSSWDADFGWDFKAGCRTEFTDAKALGTPYAKKLYAYLDAQNKQHDYRLDYILMGRSVLPEPPGIGTPHFKNPISSGHIANAMSLLVQAFK